MRSTARRRDRRERGSIRQSPWRAVTNPYQAIETLSADHVEAIHEASLRHLEETGVDFLLEEAREILEAAGAETRPGELRVRFDRGLVEDSVAKAPAQFVLHARNPEHNLTMGANHINFATVGSPPYASDIEGGRRPGNFQDYRDLLCLAQMLNVVHLFGGYPVEPTDLPVDTRHLDAVLAFITLTDKVYKIYSLGRGRILDGLEMTRIARGIGWEQLAREPSVMTVVNSNSPLRIDGPMLEGMIEMARCNQPIVFTPFTLAGAMAPVTIAGALALQNAEALAGVTFAQIVNPGAPVVYGGFTSNVDMRSGAPAFGTPEGTIAALAGGQLARRYRLPYRSSNANASNVVDAQAAYESQMSLWGAVMGHANLVLHGAGWLEGGLCASFEKMVLDAEMLQMMAAFLEPIAVDEAAFAFDAVREVGPGGHFFGCAHTLERYESAFYAPLVSDWRNYESWAEAGAETATHRAHRLYKELLAAYEAPPLDEAIREELEDFVARRKREGGIASA